MAVLVTGGAGYIGSHMVWALIDAGEEVVVIDRLSTGFRWAVAPQARFYLGDIADAGLLQQVFAENAIETIVHCAASLVVSQSLSDPLGYYENNTGNTRILAAAAIAHGVRHFVFSSSAAVYGTRQSDAPVLETAQLNPENPYGLSKLMAEIILRDAAAAHDLRYVALRYFNVVGADAAGRAGPSAEGATNLLKVACEAAYGLRDGVEVYGTDYPTHDGTGVRDYIHVSDLVEAHLLAMRHLRQGGASLIANCGYGHGYSVLDVLNAVREETGRDFKISYRPRRPGDIATMVADAGRARKVFGWKPRFDDLHIIIRTALFWERVLEGVREDQRHYESRKNALANFR